MPVSDVLDRLLAAGRGRTLTRGQLLRLELRFLAERIKRRRATRGLRTDRTWNSRRQAEGVDRRRRGDAARRAVTTRGASASPGSPRGCCSRVARASSGISCKRGDVVRISSKVPGDRGPAGAPRPGADRRPGGSARASDLVKAATRWQLRLDGAVHRQLAQALPAGGAARARRGDDPRAAEAGWRGRRRRAPAVPAAARGRAAGGGARGSSIAWSSWIPPSATATFAHRERAKLGGGGRAPGPDRAAELVRHRAARPVPRRRVPPRRARAGLLRRAVQPVHPGGAELRPAASTPSPPRSCSWRSTSKTCSRPFAGCPRPRSWRGAGGDPRQDRGARARAACAEQRPDRRARAGADRAKPPRHSRQPARRRSDALGRGRQSRPRPAAGRPGPHLPAAAARACCGGPGASAGQGRKLWYMARMRHGDAALHELARGQHALREAAEGADAQVRRRRPGRHAVGRRRG